MAIEPLNKNDEEKALEEVLEEETEKANKQRKNNGGIKYLEAEKVMNFELNDGNTKKK